jgi:hypothetical protein
MNTLMKYLLPVMALFGITSVSYAAVPANVTTALTDLLTDAGTIAAAVFIVYVSILAFNYFRKAAK